MARDPFSAKKRFLGVSEARVAYYEEGSGEPLLLLHGCPFSSFVWRKVIPCLSHCYQCLAPDLLGLGDTETPEGADWSLRAQGAMGVEHTDHHRALRPERPVGALRRLGVAQAEQIGSQTLVAMRETGDDLTPDEGRERTPVQEQQGLAAPLLVVGDPGLTDAEEALLRAEGVPPHARTSRVAFPGWQLPRLLQQAHPEVYQSGYARIGAAVNEAASLASGRDDSPVREALELVRDRLRLHTHLGRKVRDGQFSGALERVKEPQARVAGKDLVEADEFVGLLLSEQRAVAQRRLAGVGGGLYSQRYTLHSLNTTRPCVIVSTCLKAIAKRSATFTRPQKILPWRTSEEPPCLTGPRARHERLTSRQAPPLAPHPAWQRNGPLGRCKFDYHTGRCAAYGLAFQEASI